MPTPGDRKDLGKKYACPECGAKYYDMHRPVPTCPKCGTDPREATSTRTRTMAAPRPAPSTRPPRAPPPEEDEDEDEDEDDDDDDKAVEVMADPEVAGVGFHPKSGRDEDEHKNSANTNDDAFDDTGGIR